jgi:hypothetical protein
MSNTTETPIQEIREAFQNQNLSLYLGAGVSTDNNLPSWEKLVLALYFSKISEQQMQGWRPFSNYLFAIAEWHLANSTEPLEITARKLLKYYDTEDEQEDVFMEDLYQILYGSMLDRYGQPSQDIDENFLRYNNKTLDAVATLCESKNKGIRSVITYNYDNLLEIALCNFPHQSVYSSTSLENGKLPIHHVHGYVPFDKSIPGSSGNDIVFTEDQYHQVARNPYNWSNLVQLQSMTNSVGLMIGLSLSDRNMRRLLDAVRNAPINSISYALLKVPDENPTEDRVLDEIHEKAKGYLDRFRNSGVKSEQDESMGILFGRPGIKSAQPAIKSSKSGTKGPRYRNEIAGIIEQVKQLDKEQQQYVLEQLGIKPIWFHEYPEIPEILGRILQR